MWHFDVDRSDLQEIKAYLDESVVAAGPEAVRAVGNRALRDLLLGVGAVVLGIVVTVASFLNAAQNPEGGRYYITFGLIVFGLVLFGKGVYGFVRHSHLQKLRGSKRKRTGAIRVKNPSGRLWQPAASPRKRGEVHAGAAPGPPRSCRRAPDRDCRLLLSWRRQAGRQAPRPSGSRDSAAFDSGRERVREGPE